MAPKPGFDDELLLDIGLGEFEEQDSGRELVDVGDAERHDALGELVRDGLGEELVLAAAPRAGGRSDTVDGAYFDIKRGESLLHFGAGGGCQVPDWEPRSRGLQIQCFIMGRPWRGSYESTHVIRRAFLTTLVIN